MSSNRWVAGKYELIEPVGEGGMAKVWRGVTHGAVSRQVSRLERWMGIRLFERKARGVTLTPVCYFLLVEWLRHGSTPGKAARAAATDHQPASCTASIGTSPCAASTL